jgi:hemoglobin-like flavoprotein
MAVDVEALEESVDLVAPQGDELMRKFYDRLFDVAPSVQPLFADVDMDRQRQALLNMLVVLRESLRDLDDIVPDLETSALVTSSTELSPSTIRSSARCSSARWQRSRATPGSRITPPRGKRHTESFRV